MWQPNRAQWWVICTVSVLLILGWPPDNERSLGMKAVNWAVDPLDELPALPAPLPMSLDDNGDAVAAHDASEAAYYAFYERSALARWRLKLKGAADPFDPSTARQVLTGVSLLGALGVWRLGKR